MSCHISWLTAFRFSGWLKMIQPIGPSFSNKSFGVSLMRVSWARGISGHCNGVREAGMDRGWAGTAARGFIVTGSARPAWTEGGLGQKPGASLHDQAAVDADRLPGHVCRAAPGEKRDHAGHVLGALHPSERHLRS